MTTTTTVKMMRDDDDRRSASRGGAFVVPGKKILHHHHHRCGFTVNTFLFLILLLIVDVFVESSFADHVYVIPIPSESWHSFVEECLEEAPVTGECTTWASKNNYGTMPNWDTSLVEDMSGWTGSAFQGFGNKSTFDGDISKWNTAQVTYMSQMFESSLAFNQDIGSWNTEKVTRMFSMFYSASAFNQDIGSWNTEKVTTMQYMFYSASAFNQDISSWTGYAATTAQTEMFLDATAFEAKFTCTNAVTGPANSCDTIKSTWIAPSPPSPPPSPPPPPPLTPIPSESWHDFVEACLSESGAEVTGECTTWASGNNYGTIPNWDVSLVTDMSGWTGTTLQGFGGKSTFNADISKWDTGKVTSMFTMFHKASAFNQDIGSWNTARVTSMSSMFNEASAFNQDIKEWNTGKVTTMYRMFYYASAFNHDISSWTGTAATTAQGDMFTSATAFQAKFTCTNAVTGPANSCVLK